MTAFQIIWWSGVAAWALVVVAATVHLMRAPLFSRPWSEKSLVVFPAAFAASFVAAGIAALAVYA